MMSGSYPHYIFWGFWGSSAPPYSPFCTLKTCTFDPIPLENPKLTQEITLLSKTLVQLTEDEQDGEDNVGHYTEVEDGRARRGC